MPTTENRPGRSAAGGRRKARTKARNPSRKLNACRWCGQPAASGVDYCDGHCQRAANQAREHDAAVDWFRARLVQFIIRSAWDDTETILRATEIPDRAGLRRLEAWAVPVVPEPEFSPQPGE